MEIYDIPDRLFLLRLIWEKKNSDINLLPPSQKREFFLNNLIIYFFANTFGNYLIMSDFIKEKSDSSLKELLESSNLTNLIETNTCCKDEISCTGLILTNRKY